MLYWRQKVLMALLEKAPNKSASKLQFVKLLFLLKEEEKIDRYGSFYDFVPYKHGPFSFLAYRDIGKLESFGWIKSEDSLLRCVGSKSELAEFALPSSVSNCIEKIMQDYGALPQQQLIRYVYEKYPWYASRSSITRSRPSIDVPRAQPAVYSLGYEGLSIDAFLYIISRAGIQTVVDSRNNPISRKYGFSKSTLKEKCTDIGLKYYQFPEVGIPSKVRNQIQNRRDLWDLYIQEILPKATEALKLIVGICRKEPAVLICFEKKPEDCHRSIIAREISVRTGLPVIHYRSEGRKWERERKFL